MDLMKIISPILLYSIFTTFVLSQLTNTDINYIKKTVLSLQNEQNGIFGGNVENTLKSVLSLKYLNENVPLVPRICKDLSFESMERINEEMIELNEVLNCKQTFELPTELKEEELIENNLEEIYKKVSLAKIANMKLNWENLYENLKGFITEQKLFSNVNGGKTTSLMTTTKGLKILAWIYQNVEGEVKTNVNEDIENVMGQLQREFQFIREDIGLFTEENVSSLKLNSLFAEAFYHVNQVITIENLDEFQLKILNYLVTFKYDYNGLDNIYYLLRGINILSYLPIPQLEKKVFDYVEDKSIPLKFLNGFGKEISDYSVSVVYLLKDSNLIEETASKSEYDLEDDQSVKEPTGPIKVAQIEIGSSQVNLDLSELIKGPGKFTLNLKIRFANEKGKIFDQNLEIPITSLSKIKLNHLKMLITNTAEKSDEKEITVEYPKRTFKNFKLAQNSVIKLKVKFNYGDSQVNNIEQIFLRLRHSELGKSYSAYVSEHRKIDDYYYINFDFADTTIIEAYDGIYELSLIASDVSLENPMIWSFGKIDIKFRKPLDPTNLTQSYKNPQKEKMEPLIAEEESPNKNFLSSLIFSCTIISLFIYYLYYLKSQRVNMATFPKTGINFIFAFMFIVFVLLVSYILILFFVKLNIIQTLLGLLILGLPGSFIVYKALSNHYIDV